MSVIKFKTLKKSQLSVFSFKQQHAIPSVTTGSNTFALLPRPLNIMCNTA